LISHPSFLLLLFCNHRTERRAQWNTFCLSAGSPKNVNNRTTQWSFEINQTNVCKQGRVLRMMMMMMMMMMMTTTTTTMMMMMMMVVTTMSRLLK